MAHIVIVVGNVGSVQMMARALARRLQAADHRVTIASTGENRTAFDEQHIPYVQLPPSKTASLPEPDFGTGRLAKVRRVIWRWRHRAQRLETALAARGADESLAILADLAPDMLLIDVELQAHIIAGYALAQERSMPLVLFNTFMSMYKRQGAPPLHTPIVPGADWRGSTLGIEVAWWRFRWQKWRGNFKQWLGSGGADALSQLRYYARQRAFPFEQEALLYQWLIPFAYATLPVLNLNAAELDFPQAGTAPNPNVQYVGALIDLEREEAFMAQSPALMRELDTLVQRCAEEGKSLLYGAFGGHFKGDDSAFLRRVIAAVASMPQVELVLSLGRRGDIASLGDLPPHIHVYEWLPQLHLLHHADAAVIHAGIGSINECVYYGVPMLVYPFDVNDQQGNAARVMYHGVGIRGNRAHDTPATMQQHLQQLLTDDTYSQRVQAMQAHLRRYAREQSAQQVIARHFDNPSS